MFGKIIRSVRLAVVVLIGVHVGGMATAEAGSPAGTAFNWSGIYVGINAGAGLNSGNWDNAGDPNNNVGDLGTTPFNFNANDGGFVGGVQVGVNKQFNNALFGQDIVLGIEAMLDGSNVSGSDSTQCCTFPVSLTTKQRALGNVVGRVGIAADRWLVYAAGGFAFSDYQFSNENGFCCSGQYNGDSTHIGWTAGLGVEYAIWGNWILGLDWKYYDFGNIVVDDGTQDPRGPGLDVVNVSETENVITARLSYKFSLFQ